MPDLLSDGVPQSPAVSRSKSEMVFLLFRALHGEQPRTGKSAHRSHGTGGVRSSPCFRPGMLRLGLRAPIVA